jgi:starch phosphorylase
VGHENFFLFGMTADEVVRMKATGYRARAWYESNAALRESVDAIDAGFFSAGARDRFHPLVRSLLEDDQYMLLADYQSYVECQQRVADAYRDRGSWIRMSILNAARVGRFSSDRSIRDYCRDIWHVSLPPRVPGAA